jgi:uncharacterized protein (TIGR00299 family) protein
MRQAHIDAFSGASGDMLLGAVVDAGARLAAINELLLGLGLDGWRLASEPVLRGQLAATRVRVTVADDGSVVRTWANVRQLLAGAALPEPVRARALGAFSRLAGAEAQVHRMPVERVHFHEVGALDAIIDVVGVCSGLHLLGVGRVSCSTVALGTGMTRGQHGLLPVPAPAVLELLRGAPTMATDTPAELCTPTGAALLAEFTDVWGPQPPMVADRIGYGAGKRDLQRPNVVRLVLGDPVAGSPTAVLLTTTVDDLPGELVPPVLDALRAAGAGDAWALPVVMKKGRPGVEIACVADPSRSAALRDVLFRQTTTLGVRGQLVDKWVLQRSWQQVDVAGQPVRLKIGRLHGEVVNVAPEFDDCAAAAAATGLPLKEVYARARGAWPGVDDRT